MDVGTAAAGIGRRAGNGDCVCMVGADAAGLARDPGIMTVVGSRPAGVVERRAGGLQAAATGRRANIAGAGVGSDVGAAVSRRRAVLVIGAEAAGGECA